MNKLLAFTMIGLSILCNNYCMARSLQDSKATSTYQNESTERAIVTENGQTFEFIGCADEERSFRDVADIMISAQKAWNAHDLDSLLKNYSPNFVSKDGMHIQQISDNLIEFWGDYPNSKLSAAPARIFVCGDFATVTLDELITGTGKDEGQPPLNGRSNFKAWIRGNTHLNLTASGWKITFEDITFEKIWKFYGHEAQEYLTKGKIKLILPSRVEAQSNYIAQLRYNLPEDVRAVGVIDKILLAEETKDSSKVGSGELSQAEKSRIEDQQLEEYKSLRRGLVGKSPEGLRRLLKANSTNQDEMVRAQLELVRVQGDQIDLIGLIGISQRVVPAISHSVGKDSAPSVVSSSFAEDWRKN